MNLELDNQEVPTGALD